MTPPPTAQRLLLDGAFGERQSVTLSVKIRPETATVLIYASAEDEKPVRCQGPRQIVILECRSGEIFVEKPDSGTHVEIRIIDPV
jgi:hypothetical protein